MLFSTYPALQELNSEVGVQYNLTLYVVKYVLLTSTRSDYTITGFCTAHLWKGNTLYYLPQDCPLVGNPEVGISEFINHQDCLPWLRQLILICFEPFMANTTYSSALLWSALNFSWFGTSSTCFKIISYHKFSSEAKSKWYIHVFHLMYIHVSLLNHIACN